MALHINIPISNGLYDRAERIAKQLNKEVSEILAVHLEATFSEEIRADDLVAEQERLAYHALHPELLAQHEGKYVAIYQGKLVDFDDDKLRLFRRIDKQFPDDFVLIRQVMPNPEPELRRIGIRWAGESND